MTHELLYLIGQLRAGGQERQLYLLLRVLDRKRYQPGVAVWNYCETDVYVAKLRALGVPMYPISGYSVADKLYSLRKLVCRVQARVLHSYSFYTNALVALAVTGRDMVAIGSVRSDFHDSIREAGLLRGLLSARFPRYQIYNNHAAARQDASSHRPFVPKRVWIIRNGVELEQYTMIPLATNRPLRVLAIGSLLPVKRWDRLLRITKMLVDRGISFELALVGEGPIRHELEVQRDALGLGGRVALLGHSDDIPKLLAESSCLAHTADIEGCPNAVIEAMASTRAVVSTAVGDVPDLVENDVSGFVVPREDEVLFAERLGQLLSDRALCQRMGENARQRAEKEFSLDRLVAQTLSIYRAGGWREGTA